jgi:hypothetical protein
METGMKLWTGVLLASIALVAVGGLPPDLMDVRPTHERTHEEARLHALRQEIRVANDAAKRFDWAEEYTAYLFEHAVDGLALRREGSMTDSAVARYRALLTDQLEPLPSRAPGVVAGAFWVGLETGGHPDIRPYSNEADLEYYMGVENDQPYCFTIKPQRSIGNRDLVQYRSGWGWSTRGNGLSTCRLVVQHGLPGARVAEWLADGAIAFGHGVRGDVDLGDQWRSNRRGLFGISYRYANQRPEVERCMARVAASCLEQFLSPRGERVELSGKRQVAEISPLLVAHQSSTFSIPGNLLFDDLQTEFGADAFHAFWTSDQDITSAFETAFGVDVQTWIMTWVDANFSVMRRGPALTKSARFGGLLGIMLFGMLAGLIHRRRKVA